MSELRPHSLDRIVVRSTNWVGDAVITIPALRQLRRILPNAHITLATRSWASDLFQSADFIDELLISDASGMLSTLGQAKEWRTREFDLALLLTNSFASALIPALAGVPTRIGYATEHRSFLLTKAVPLPEWRSTRHEAYYYLNLVETVGKSFVRQVATEPIEPIDGSLEISETTYLLARHRLAENGIHGDRPLVALCPGSINSRAKRWPAERYALLADRIIKELGAVCVLIGSPAELDVSLAVKERMTSDPILLTGKTSLGQLVGLLSQVDLLITNDTGPAHIASALGRPTLAIFGPTNPLTTRPLGASAEILRRPPDCAPCMLRDCPIDHRCMTAIGPDEVFERVNQILQRNMSSVLHL
jgi:heptosyltransferase-2